MNYFTEELFNSVKKQKKKTLMNYFIVLGVYLAISVGLFIWFRTLTYRSKTITIIKVLHYTLSAVMVFFSFIYLGIKYKMVKKFYKALNNVKIGIKEEYVAEFIGCDETLQTKEGVEYKCLLFKEWNKYKKDFYERKVLVFYELPFPEIETGKKVKFITQANLLVEYEYITENN